MILQLIYFILDTKRSILCNLLQYYTKMPIINDGIVEFPFKRSVHYKVNWFLPETNKTIGKL